MKPKTNSLWFLKKFQKSLNFSILYERIKMRREKWEKLKNPGNRFSTYAQIIGCNKKVRGLERKILHHEITKI